MGYFVSVLLPILAIKVGDIQHRWACIQTVYIDVDSIGIRAWRIERLDTTVFAKSVFRHPGIEDIGGEGVFAGQKAELAQRQDQMEKTRLGAN